jgi:hypothetical protein
MSGHLGVRTLSAYLDRELALRDSGRVESHLSDCPQCREQLDGLRRVVAELQRTGPMRTLPELVDRRLRSRLAAQSRPRTLLERVESRMRRFAPQGTSIPMVFALVMGLVAVVYLFAWGSYRYAERVEERARVEASVPRVHLGGREWFRDGDRWIESGIDPAAELRRVALGSRDADALLRELPALERLLTDSSAVAVVADGGAVLLVAR